MKMANFSHLKILFNFSNFFIADRYVVLKLQVFYHQFSLTSGTRLIWTFFSYDVDYRHMTPPITLNLPSFELQA